MSDTPETATPATAPHTTPGVAPDATAHVDHVLARTGLIVTAAERERLIRIYPMIAEWTGGLRLPETRYAEPALIYPADFDR